MRSGTAMDQDACERERLQKDGLSSGCSVSERAFHKGRVDVEVHEVRVAEHLPGQR